MKQTQVVESFLAGRRVVIAKYVAKENAWWNVKLLGQRHPANQNFKLE